MVAVKFTNTSDLIVQLSIEAPKGTPHYRKQVNPHEVVAFTIDDPVLSIFFFVDAGEDHGRCQQTVALEKMTSGDIHQACLQSVDASYDIGELPVTVTAST